MRAAAGSPPSQVGTFRAPDGATIAWCRTGSGPTMLIYNGLLSTALHWREWIAHYRERFTVVTFDYRGHGDSPRPARLSTVRIEQHADDGHALLAALDLPRPAIVCGLSLGVQCSLEHYRRHPDDIGALVLLCGTWGRPLDRLTSSSATIRRLALGSLSLAAKGGPAVRAATWPLLRTRLGREMAYLTGGADRATCPAEVLDELYRHIAGMDVDVIMAAISSYLEHTAEEVLPRVEIPTVVVAGGEDKLTPPEISEEMVRRIPNARLHVVSGHTHLALVEKPAEVHGVVDRFLDETRS